MIRAICHCGAVVIEVDSLPPTATQCNCSICRRLGAIFAHRARSQARLVAGHDALSAYLWGDRTIEFYHCRHCGCCTHYEDVEKNTDSRFSINARCLEPDVLATLRVRRFDGAKTWQFLD
jgi:hypothetical protein